MCMGFPMQVLQCEGSHAWCGGMGEKRRVDTLLVGPRAPGTWLLVYLDSAREVLTPTRAAHITAALEAVARAMAGEGDMDHLFADLVDREPPLPDFLRPLSKPVPGD